MLYVLIFLVILAFIAFSWILGHLLFDGEGWKVALAFVLIALFLTGLVGFFMSHKSDCSFLDSKYCTYQGK